MTTQTEALKMALDVLATTGTDYGSKQWEYENEAIAFIREALAVDKESLTTEAQQSNEQVEPVELAGVKATIEEGDGLWRECTGCYETNEGYPPKGAYFSKVFKCYLGNGCDECGGIGAIWDTTDYEEMAKFMFEDAHPPVPTAQPNLEKIADDLQELCDKQALRIGALEAQLAQPKEPEQEFVCSTGLCHYKAQPEQRSVSEQQEPVAIPDCPESESLADLEYAQNTPETWEPEYRQVWQELQVAERNKAILRRYAKELRALLTTPPQRKPMTDEQAMADFLNTDVVTYRKFKAWEAAHGIKE